MTYQELLDVLLERNAAFTNMQPTSLQAPTIDQIISGIQSQYQQPAMQPMMPSAQAGQSFGASRFTDGPQTFSQQAFTPVANSGSSFKPSEFDIDLYRNIDDKALSSLISQLGDSEGGGYGGSAPPSGLSVDDVGLSSPSVVSPGTIQAIGAALGIFGGVPGSFLIGMGKNAIASALTAAGYNSAVANNMAMVANSMGLDPNDPANFAAISSAIDSLSANNAGTSYATPGTSGTGGSAAQAGQQAAAVAQSMGLSAEQTAQIAQAAVNAVISGKSVSEAVQIASNTVASVSANTNNQNSAPEGGGFTGADPGGMFGGAMSGDVGFAKGGKVLKSKLSGKNPKGKDDGYAALEVGEYVIKKSSVDKYGDSFLSAINEGKISKKKLESLS
jgi:hypothetical protein